MKAIFPEKVNTIQVINFTEEDKTDQAIAEIFNENFAIITESLGIMQYSGHIPLEITKNNPIEKIFKVY